MHSRGQIRLIQKVLKFSSFMRPFAASKQRTSVGKCSTTQSRREARLLMRGSCTPVWPPPYPAPAHAARQVTDSRSGKLVAAARDSS